MMSALIPERKKPRTEPIRECPACNDEDTKPFFSAPDRLHGVPGVFHYHLCNKCGSVFQNPMVVQEDIHLCYPEIYAPYSLKREIPDVDFDNLPTGSVRDEIRRAIVSEMRGNPVPGLMGFVGRILARSSLMRVRAYYGLLSDELLPKGRGENFALDLGCGSGWLMEKLETVGWRTDGLEWNESAADIARGVTAGQVWTGDFRTAELPKEKYQLIVLNHVFEHINEPTGALLRVRELLRDGGKAVLFYPNPRSVGALWYKTEWFPWEVPRHLIFVTPNSLRDLARKTGFAKCRVFTRANYSEVHWSWSKAYRSGLNPDSTSPELAFNEKIGVFAEKLLNSIGFERGWEIVAVLEK